MATRTIVLNVPHLRRGLRRNDEDEHSKINGLLPVQAMMLTPPSDDDDDDDDDAMMELLPLLRG